MPPARPQTPRPRTRCWSLGGCAGMQSYPCKIYQAPGTLNPAWALSHRAGHRHATPLRQLPLPAAVAGLCHTCPCEIWKPSHLGYSVAGGMVQTSICAHRGTRGEPRVRTKSRSASVSSAESCAKSDPSSSSTACCGDRVTSAFALANMRPGSGRRRPMLTPAT